MGGDPYIGVAIGNLGIPLRIYEDQSARAGEMLSKIYDYCGQTNGAYSSAALQTIIPACSSACAAMSASADPASWDAQDYGSLVNDIKQAAVTPVKSMEDIYTHNDGGSVVNEDNVHTLMGKPFELWTQEEFDACAKAYNAMSDNDDTDSIKAFINASYSFKGTEDYTRNDISQNQTDYTIYQRDRWELEQGFAGFARAHAYLSSSIALEAQKGNEEHLPEYYSRLWKNAASSGLLWGMANNAGCVYASPNSPLFVGKIELVGDDTKSVASFYYCQGEFDEKNIDIKASGNLLSYSDLQQDEAFVELKIDVNKELGESIGWDLAEDGADIVMPGLGRAITGLNNSIDYRNNVIQNETVDSAVMWKDINNSANGAHFNGIVCDADGAASVLGQYNETELSEDITSYNDRNPDNKDTNFEDVRALIQDKGLCGALHYNGDEPKYKNASTFLNESIGNAN